MSPHITQLFSLLYNEGKFDQLFKAVEQGRERMEKAGEMDLWNFWHSITLAAQGDLEASEAAAKSLSGEAQIEAKRLVILQRARQTKDYSMAIQFLEHRWRESGSAIELFSLCEMQLEAGNPTFVVEHASRLLEEINTIAALRLAVTGAVRCQNWHLCLKLLDSSGNLFPSGTLPGDLRRLRVSSAQSLGMLEEAKNEAEALVKEEANPENLSLLFGVHVRAGNLKDAMLPARELVHLPGTPPETLLQVANVMRLEDPAIASNALQKAVDRGLKGPENVSLATTVAAQLNLDSLMKVLVPKMVEEAGLENPFLRKASLEEVIEYQRAYNENSLMAMSELRAGRIPIHSVRRVLNIPLAAWVVVALDHPTGLGTLSPYFPVFFRHGGRPANPPLRKINRLYVDITSLHLSYQLGILPLIEETFGPVYLPPAARLSLIQQSDDANRNQPNVVAGHQKVAQCIADGQIEVWTSDQTAGGVETERDGINIEWWNALSAAQLRGGLLVDFWPKLRHEKGPFVPSTEGPTNFTSMNLVIAALEKAGEIEIHLAEAARQRFSNFDSAEAVLETPQPGQVLFLSSGIAEQFAEAGLLDAVAKFFALVVSNADVLLLRQQIAQHTNWQKLSEHLQGLRDHIMASSSYRGFTLQNPHNDDRMLPPGDAAETCLVELLQAETGEGHFAWIDDRMLNAHGKCGEIPIISTLGVIEELFRLEKLSKDQYFALRHHLRAGDLRYVPLTADEILYYLAHAPLKDGFIVETPELAVLRRYHARVWLDNQGLQIPANKIANPNPQGEIGLLHATMGATTSSLKAIFDGDSQPAPIKIAKADWVLHNLWIEPGHFLTIVGQSAPKTEKMSSLAGLGDGLLLKSAITLGIKSKDTKRKEYFDWLQTRMFADPQRAREVAKQVREMLEGDFWKKALTKKNRLGYVGVMQTFYLSLPESIRRFVNLRTTTKKELFVGRKAAITIGNAQFEPERFWIAAEGAFKGANVSVQAVNKGPEFELFRRVHNGKQTMMVQEKATSKTMGVEDDLFDILHPTISSRISALCNHCEWFDSFENKSDIEIKRIAKIPKASQRASAVEAARSHSAWYYYSMFAKSCFSQQGPTLDQMAPPSPDMLASFFRFTPESEKDEIDSELRQCTIKLLSQVGFNETFRRLATLPIPLPLPIADAYRKMSPRDRKKGYKALLDACHTPLARIHLLGLLLNIHKTISTEAKALLTKLLSSDEVKETSVFLEVITWAWNQLGVNKSLHVKRRLTFAWAHGSILFGLLRQISKLEDIIGFARQYGRSVPGELIANAEGEQDMAFSRVLAPEMLIITGVGVSLKSAGFDFGKTGSSLLQNAKELCFMIANDVRMPKLQWLQDPSLRQDRLHSFLAFPRDVVTAPLLGEELAKELSGQRVHIEFETLVAALERDLNQPLSWVLLSALLAQQSCPLLLKKRLFKLVEKVPWEALEFNDVQRHTVLVAFSAHAWDLGGQVLCEIMQRRIARDARQLRSKRTDEAQDARNSQTILLAIQSLARNGPREESARIFADAFVACIDQWPGLVDYVPGATGQMLLLPSAQLAQTWKLILRLRYGAERSHSTKILKTSI